MSYPANHRGWGPGWPVDRSDDMVTIRSAVSRTRFTVHRDVAPILQHVVDEIERRGYLIHTPGDVHDDWSYVSRPIRGTRKPSNHSWGLAVDIDATKYPQGQRRRRPPQWIVDLFAHWGWGWGGTWSYADPMHFEYAGSRTEARWMVAALAASHMQGRPVEVPASAPDLVAVHGLLQEDNDMILICQGKGIAHVIDSRCWSAITLEDLVYIRAQYKAAGRSLPELDVSAVRWNAYLS